jgi:alcohol dehydrogenase class IV
MDNLDFQFYRTPRIFFGPGQKDRLSSLVIPHGSPVLLIHSPHSLPENFRQELSEKLQKAGIELFICLSKGEPSPDYIDSVVNQYRDTKIKSVIAIGGGSVLDAGKAISAMLPLNESVRNFLEVIGNKKHSGNKVPFFALPTTSGTGSEASANAVLSLPGKNGFKRSIRHENFVPDYAIVDPQLMLNCPDNVTASCSMDALTQLLESYVSPKASVLTDSLIEKALPLIGKNLLRVSSTSRSDINARTAMAYAALISGITLANAGLGVVHGIASAIGGLFPVPHGVICGTLLSEATSMNIRKLNELDPSSIALKKYSRAGFLLSRKKENAGDGSERLSELLDTYTRQLAIPKLSHYGIGKDDLEKILRDSDNKNNPVVLTSEEMGRIITERI